MDVTQETVNVAVEAILAAGGRPTSRAVRDHLGGGSFTTIGPMIALCKKMRDEVEADAAVELSEPVKQAVTALAGRITRVAQEEAEASCLVARREAEEMVAQAAEDLDEGRAVIAQLERERDAAFGEARQAAAAQAKAERAIVVDRKKADSDTAAAEAKVVRLEERVAAREREAVQAEARAEAAEAKTARLRDRVEVLVGELAALRAERTPPGVPDDVGSGPRLAAAK